MIQVAPVLVVVLRNEDLRRTSLADLKSRMNELESREAPTFLARRLGDDEGLEKTGVESCTPTS